MSTGGASTSPVSIQNSRRRTSASHAHGCTGPESVRILCTSNLKALHCEVEEIALVWSEVRVMLSHVLYRCRRAFIEVLRSSYFPTASKMESSFRLRILLTMFWNCGEVVPGKKKLQ